MSILTSILAVYHRSGLRGGYRVGDLLARHLKSLHSVPIEVEGGFLYVDLRQGSARGLLAQPKTSTGEDDVMRHFVRPADIAFDIGAHLGLYTLLLSDLTGSRGKVYAFEPNPALLPGLRRTIGPHRNIELLECALSDEPGNIELFVPENASMASLSDWTDGVAGAVHCVECDVKVIDDMVASGAIPIPSFIKCDVEGGELAVFRGARQILNREGAPVILFEVNAKAAGAFDTEVNAVFDFLASLDRPGYTFFLVTSDGLSPLETHDLDYANILAIPAARLADCSPLLPND